MPALPRFLLVYAAMFSAFGVASPFLPGLLQQDGLGAGEIGLVLGCGTAVRLLWGPLGGRLADRSGRAPLVLAGFCAASAAVALGYGVARGLWPLLLVGVAHAAVLAPLTPVADALALGSARRTAGGRADGGRADGAAHGAAGEPRDGAAGRPTRGGRGFPYGAVRAMGSGAFVAGVLLSGQAVGRHGLGVVVWLNAGLLALAAALAGLLPNRMAGVPEARDAGGREGARREAGAPGSDGHHPVAGPAAPGGEEGMRGALRRLLGIPAFRRTMAAAALIGGSHALHDGFEVIRWRAAGLSAGQVSVLWSLSVASEVLVFLVLGRWLLDRLGPAGGMALSAVAGIVRWGTAARTAAFPAMALVEPLHGLTFALLHLACMEVIAAVVPGRLAATAQAFYATVAMGATAALVTLASGPLYGALGAGAFWGMAAMCAAAVPVAAGMPGRRAIQGLRP